MAHNESRSVDNEKQIEEVPQKSKAAGAGYDFRTLSIFPPSTSQVIQRAVSSTAHPLNMPIMDQHTTQERNHTERHEAPESSEGANTGMPKEVQAKMEVAFETDFSDVKVHANSQKASRIKALAYTQGHDIHFSPGRYSPTSQMGQKLLGHELTHVIQQRARRVSMPQGKGAPINVNMALEAEADALGEKAAKGEVASVANLKDTGTSHDNSTSVIQAKFDYDVVIVGAGTSAVEYMATADWSLLTGKNEPEVAAIGKKERWEQMEKEHQMGQPAHILALSGSGVPAYSTKFMTAEEYTAALEQVKRKTAVEVETNSVSEIIWYYDREEKSNGYIIEEKNKSYTAKRVIIASGPGPARQKEKVTRENEVPTSYKKVIDGDEYTREGTEMAPGGSEVAIEGGSATASWAYEKAYDKGKYGVDKIYWFVRSDFKNAFPPGERNERIDRLSRDYRQAGKVLTSVSVKGKKVHLFFGKDEKVVDQYVVAIGSDIKGTAPEGGAWAILPNIRDQLQVIYDQNRYFYDDEKQTVIGLATDDKSLIVVGAAVFNMLNEKSKEGQKYAEANKTLPPNATPPEGIPTIVATIEALNNYMPPDIAKRVNYNLANRTQLAVHIASKYPFLSPQQADGFVVQIVDRRTKAPGTFGIDQKDIEALEQEMAKMNEDSKARQRETVDYNIVSTVDLARHIEARFPYLSEESVSSFVKKIQVMRGPLKERGPEKKISEDAIKELEEEMTNENSRQKLIYFGKIAATVGTLVLGLVYLYKRR